MARIPENKEELYKSLNVVYWHAREHIEYRTEQLNKKPPNGWSQERHEAYIKREIAEAQAAQKWVFVEIMRINPD